MEPDIFKININGINGEFIIGNDLSVKTNLGAAYKIDIEALTTQSPTTTTPYVSTIIVTDPSGYIYTFGGKIEAMEYFTPQMYFKGIPSAWHLTKIQMPTGRQVIYNYSSNINNLTQKYYYNFYQLSVDFIPGLGWSQYGGNPISSVFAQTTKKVAPITIQIDDCIISFDYQNESQKFYNDKPDTNPLLQINRISISHKYITSNDIKFNYSYKDNRRFLKTVIFNDIEKYSFDYVDKNILPTPLTQSVDHWGYWRGGCETAMNVTVDMLRNGTIYNNDGPRAPSSIL